MGIPLQYRAVLPVHEEGRPEVATSGPGAGFEVCLA